MYDDFSFWRGLAVISFMFTPFLVIAFASGNISWMLIQSSIVIFLVCALKWMNGLDSD